MTTLTPNRIIQQGDEYRNNGTWKAVPKEDYGLQVMFTKYAEVRRPSEIPRICVQGSPPRSSKKQPPVIPAEWVTPPTTLQQGSETVTRHAHNVETAGSTPAPAIISPDRTANPAKAEKEKTPAPTPSGAGAPSPRSYPDFAGEFEKAVKAAGLPTVVSVKAHQDAIKHPEFVGHVERLTATHVTETEKALEEAKAIGMTIKALDLQWPKNGCTWTGRNGTFDGVGMEIRSMGDKVSLCPRGKRGLGNAEIQFPVSVIPQIVDWLEDQYKGTPK